MAPPSHRTHKEDSYEATTIIMKPPSLFSSSVAVGDSVRRLGYWLSLLACIHCCSSRRNPVTQKGEIANSLQTLTDSAKAQEQTLEKVSCGLTKLLSFVATDFLPCEEGWLKLGTSCYFISEDTSSWQESREKCIAMDSDFVKVTTYKEYNFLRDLVKGHNTWVGLTDLDVEGTFVWTDGTVHSIIDSWWVDGQPTNNGGNEHCVHFWVKKDSRWNDAPCNREYRYICEKSIYPILDCNH